MGVFGFLFGLLVFLWCPRVVVGVVRFVLVVWRRSCLVCLCMCCASGLVR